MKTKKDTKPAATESRTKEANEVIPSTLISIEVEGGTITGRYVKTQARTSKHGDEYVVHIFDKASGISLSRSENKPAAFAEGRYAVFGRTRLDRLMREVDRGEVVKIDYLGKMENENAGPDGQKGEHHAFKVVVIA